MQNGWIEFGLYIVGVFLIVQTLRHIKYLTTFYGGKYPLIYLGISIVYPVFAVGKNGYFTKVTDFFAITVFFWLIYLAIRLVIAFRNSEMWESFKSGLQKGQNLANYQIGGDTFKSSSSGREKKPIFGSAAKPPPPRSKKETTVPAQSKAKETVVKKSGPKTKKESTARPACYNCRYWTGNRQLLSAAGNFIEYEDVDAKCAPGGGRQHTKVSPRATCNSFEKQFG
jgi:hypothetical protein